MNIESLHQLFLESNTVCRDTRDITHGCIFFALKGANFNGNTFAKDAIDKGASYAVVDEEAYVLNDKYILVEDTLIALQQLAKKHRTYLNLKIIALTGSNGKTTTKELINCVLQKKYNTVATLGNLNNHIGVPLTLLTMTKNTEIGIVEMGANHLKEIEELCAIAKPDYGYITNFGKAHLEGFGSIEGVIKGKSELYNHLRANNKLIFINAEDDIQLQQLENYKKHYKFGTHGNTPVVTTLANTNPFVKTNFNNHTINSNLIGAYNFNNISAAIAIGHYFEVNDNDIKYAIESFIPENNRSQIIEKKSNTIVLDAYNANPTSMTAALDNFNSMEGRRKIAILGDMFELGPEAENEHRSISKYASSLNIDAIYLVGSNFYNAKTEANKIIWCEHYEDLQQVLNHNSIKNSSILIKGSRGMALERILEIL